MAGKRGGKDEHSHDDGVVLGNRTDPPAGGGGGGGGAGGGGGGGTTDPAPAPADGGAGGGGGRGRGREVPPPPLPDSSFTPVANAVGYVVATPHFQANAVTVNWAPPTEGEADGYTVELVGLVSIDVPGTARSVEFDGLAPDTEVVARVTARRGTASASLDAPAVLVDTPPAAPAPDPAPAPAPTA